MTRLAPDPRALKRERAAIRRELIALIERRLGTNRCFWTWVWGHDYGTRSMLTTRSSSAHEITRCDVCHTPCSWDSFSAWDLIRFAEGSRGPSGEEPIATEEELAPFEERWRRLP